MSRSPSTSSVRAALVGCGPRGTGHARAYAAVPSCSLVACCDVDEKCLTEFADAFSIPGRFLSFEEMMREVRPDVVSIATPPTVRRPLVQTALRFRPRAILLEKPLALLPEEGYGIVRDCSRAGVGLFLNHQLRFFAPLGHLREALARGELGEIRFVRATTRWSLLEHGTHLFDLVSFLFEDELGFRSVLAQTSGAEVDPALADSPLYTAGIVRCRDDVSLYFECGPGAPEWPGRSSPWHQFGVDVVGTRGSAGCSLNRGWWCRAEDYSAEEAYDHDAEDDRAQARLIESILMACDDPLGHGNGPRASMLSFNLVMAAQRSSLHRAWVDVLAPVEDDEIETLRELEVTEGTPATGVLEPAEAAEPAPVDVDPLAPALEAEAGAP